MSQCVEGAAIDLCAFPLETGFFFCLSPTVQFFHYPLEGLLEAHRIVDLKDHLPRRSRKNRTINCEYELPTERSSKIFADINTMFRFQLFQVIHKFRIDRTERAE